MTKNKEVIITKTDWYYMIEDEQGNYIIEPFPKKLKMITLIIVKDLPRDIKEQILDKLIIGTRAVSKNRQTGKPNRNRNFETGGLVPRGPVNEMVLNQTKPVKNGLV